MLVLVKSYSGNKRPSRKRAGPAEPVAALRAMAIELHDKGDGHGVDFADVAASLFKAAFACLDQAGGSARAVAVARRAHDGAYARLTGSPDSGTPYPATRSDRAPAAPDEALTPGLMHRP